MGGLAKDANIVLDILDTRELSNRDRVDQLRQRAKAQIAEPEWPRKVSLNWDSRLTAHSHFRFHPASSRNNGFGWKEFRGMAIGQ